MGQFALENMFVRVIHFGWIAILSVYDKSISTFNHILSHIKYQHSKTYGVSLRHSHHSFFVTLKFITWVKVKVYDQFYRGKPTFPHEKKVKLFSKRAIRRRRKCDKDCISMFTHIAIATRGKWSCWISAKVLSNPKLISRNHTGLIQCGADMGSKHGSWSYQIQATIAFIENPGASMSNAEMWH